MFGRGTRVDRQKEGLLHIAMSDQQPHSTSLLTLRASSAASNSSWQVLSSTRLNVMGFVSPSAGGKEGSSLPRSAHRSAYLEKE